MIEKNGPYNPYQGPWSSELQTFRDEPSQPEPEPKSQPDDSVPEESSEQTPSS